MVNEPLVLHLEVSAPFELEGLDLKATGLRIQREIKKPATNRRVFWIEPDTSTAGRFNGSIAVVDRQGKVLSTVSVNGEVKPHVRVSPSRLFLGSLEYGTTSGQIIERRFRLSSPGDWKVISVDTSEISGAEHELSDLGSGAKELRLRFPENALKTGAPFGAFVNRIIRIQTDVAAQPQVELPLTAMLSKNGTSRNFKTFVFKGNERWQGKWLTPNIAAAVLGPLVLLAVGYGIWLWRDPERHPICVRSVATVLCAAGFLGMFFLVKTYSRGGWLAFGVGLTAMFVLMKRSRWGVAGAGVVFGAFVILSPSGVDRAASASAVGADASIGNRLLVWRGALEMIADHPLTGVGAARFGKVFGDFYQEGWHKPSYSTALNDYLTFASERGLLAVLACLAVGTFLIVTATQLLSKRGDEWLAPIVATLATLSSSSLFSSLQSVQELRWITFTGLALLLAYCVACLVPRQSWSRDDATLRLWVRSGFAAGLLSGVFGVGVVWAGVTRSVRHLVSESGSSYAIGTRSLTYAPRRGQSQGTILFLPLDTYPLEAAGRQVLRPLAQSGWTAVALDLPAYDQDAVTHVQKWVKEAGQHPMLVIAEGERARVAVGTFTAFGNESRPLLAFVAPKLSSALLDDHSSHAATKHLQIETIALPEWRAFLSDARLDSHGTLQRILALAGASQSQLFYKRNAIFSAQQNPLTASTIPPQFSDSNALPPELLQ